MQFNIQNLPCVHVNSPNFLCFFSIFTLCVLYDQVGPVTEVVEKAEKILKETAEAEARKKAAREQAAKQ